jgi:hypothetical protein
MEKATVYSKNTMIGSPIRTKPQSPGYRSSPYGKALEVSDYSPFTYPDGELVTDQLDPEPAPA